MRNHGSLGRCPACGSQLNKTAAPDRTGLCEACSTKAASATSAAAVLQDTLVYWDDAKTGLRNTWRHLLVLGAIGVVALIAYFIGA